MKANLTATFVKKLEPKARPYDARDTGLKGFLIRVWPSGKKTWIVEYGRGRREVLGRLDKGLKAPEAREEAEKKLAQSRLGRDPLAEKRAAKAKDLASFLADVYLPWAVENLKSGAGQARRIRVPFADLLGLKLASVTPWQIEKHRSRRLKEGVSVATINKDVSALKAALGRAVSWGLLKDNPLASVRRLREPVEGRVRFLTEEEEGRLRSSLEVREARRRKARESANRWRRERGYRELPDYGEGYTDRLAPIVLTALNTGLRRGELFNLRWEDLDFPASMLTVAAGGAKTARVRRVPLNREAREVLIRWRGAEPRAGLVFSGDDGGRLDNINRAWRNLTKAAKLEDFTFHDCRHTFASRMVAEGIDLLTVSRLLGHSSLSMTERYSHLAPARLQAAVETIRPRLADSKPEEASGG